MHIYHVYLIVAWRVRTHRHTHTRTHLHTHKKKGRVCEGQNAPATLLHSARVRANIKRATRPILCLLLRNAKR